MRADHEVSGIGPVHSTPSALQGTVLAWRTARSSSTSLTTPMLSKGMTRRIVFATRSKTSCISRVSDAISAISESTSAAKAASIVPHAVTGDSDAMILSADRVSSSMQGPRDGDGGNVALDACHGFVDRRDLRDPAISLKA